MKTSAQCDWKRKCATGNFEPISDATVKVQVAPERDTPFKRLMQPSGQNDGPLRRPSMPLPPACIASR